jgi:short-subunit dehydrogenase
MDIKDRVVLITGASRGLGAEIARAFAAEGARLVLTARSADDLERVRQATNREALVVAGDVRDPTLDERLLSVMEPLGGCDILVNNAGLENIGEFVSQSWSDIAALMQVNLLAPMRLTHALLPGMLARERGHIANVASLMGLAGPAGCESYCASKHGLVGFTRALRASLIEKGASVSASVICPGFVSEAGMYMEMRRDSGIESPAIIGRSTPRAVASAVVAAVRGERACVIVNPVPVAPMLALSALFPRLGEALMRVLGINRYCATVARSRSPLK